MIVNLNIVDLITAIIYHEINNTLYKKNYCFIKLSIISSRTKFIR